MPQSSLIKWQTSLHNIPHHNLPNTSYQQTYTRSHPSLHSLRQKSLNSSFPVILLVRLILFHLISFKPFILQLFLHSLTSLTHPFTSLHTSAFKQACITQLLKKPTLNPTLLGNYRPVSLLPFIAKTLERVVFNQVTAFLTQNNLLDSNQSGFRSGYSTERNCLALSCWRPKTRKNGFQVFITYIAGSVCCFWYGQPPDPPVNPIEKGHLRNRTPVVWLLPLR